MKKILLLVGTRPEVVKMAPVFHALRRESSIDPIFCVTGQHDEMLSQALEAFDIVPQANMNVMKPGQNLSVLTGQILRGTSELLESIKPQSVLVHGDTTTAFSVALASFYNNVEVGHVEAGLRTYDLKAPFPEEANRQLISRLATWNFAPTAIAAGNLASESVAATSIFVTGNTVVDALSFIVEKFKDNQEFFEATRQSLTRKTGFDCTSGDIVLVTAHRRENLGSGLVEICRSIRELANLYPEMRFLFPMHPNPNVRDTVRRELSSIENVTLRDPLAYSELVFTIMHSKLILTDSGGIQEEGVTLGKHVLVLREKTERPEGLATGLLTLVGADAKTIVESAQGILGESRSEFLLTRLNSSYGDGHAAQRIADVLTFGKVQSWDCDGGFSSESGLMRI